MKAKKLAALQLLERLKGAAATAEAESKEAATLGDVTGAGKVEEDGSTKISSKSSPGCALVPWTAESPRLVELFYADLRSRAGKTLASLADVALNRPHTHYCQMLCEISEEQNIEVSYLELPERTAAGEHQYIVQLGCMPVVVCHAMGRTADEARALAAHNALQYLRIMTKKL